LPGLGYSWNAGDTYDGGFKADVRHGASTYTFFNGETFNCTWTDGRCPKFTSRQRTILGAPVNGSGKFKFLDGEYDGEWRGGERHGHGIFRFDDGVVYEGEWSNDERTGSGKEVDVHGAIYEGEWSRGFRHGRGLHTYAVDGKKTQPGRDYSWNAGDKFDGAWKDHKRHGACTYTFFNGETFNCTWTEDRCSGFASRQRAVRAAPDHESAQARAEGYASVQTKREALAAAEVLAAAETKAAAEAKAVAEAADKVKYSLMMDLLEQLGLQAHIPTFM
jgi:hypothetical protein